MGGKKRELGKGSFYQMIRQFEDIITGLIIYRKGKKDRNCPPWISQERGDKTER